MDVEFVTENVDGVPVKRTFDDVSALRTEWRSEDCDLPSGDDKVISLKLGGSPIYCCQTFDDVVELLLL